MIADDKISFLKLTEIAQERFGDLVKAVVDINRCVMAIREIVSKLVQR